MMKYLMVIGMLIAIPITCIAEETNDVRYTVDYIEISGSSTTQGFIPYLNVCNDSVGDIINGGKLIIIVYADREQTKLIGTKEYWVYPQDFRGNLLGGQTWRGGRFAVKSGYEKSEYSEYTRVYGIGIFGSATQSGEYSAKFDTSIDV